MKRFLFAVFLVVGTASMALATTTDVITISTGGLTASITDGGACVGQGATTVDVTEPYWKVIKEGAITEKQIAEALKGQ